MKFLLKEYRDCFLIGILHQAVFAQLSVGPEIPIQSSLYFHYGSKSDQQSKNYLFPGFYCNELLEGGMSDRLQNFAFLR